MVMGRERLEGMVLAYETVLALIETERQKLLALIETERQNVLALIETERQKVLGRGN